MSVIGKRLKQARVNSGLSQEALGLEAGLEADSASARMNRYEVGTRAPTHELMERVAKVLGVPVSFFYETDNTIAELLMVMGKLSKGERVKLLDAARRSLKR
ncbi:helix-turn-helix domain-containing protein [Roseateles sp. BYS78W]|uniref:Helix-turn-helix domain-containing protein n=1 Tax=Pelomonas candidula TaxID=3299025 RepID=A0ABW7HI57_9BURK